MNWNVNELLGRVRCWIMFWGKTLKTTHTTTRNWIVDDLLGSPLLEEVEMVHQLLRQVRLATQASRRDVLERDLGHVDNLLGNRRQTRGQELEDVRQLFHHLQHRSIESLDQLVTSRGPAIVRRELKILGRSHPGAGANVLSPLGGVRCVHLRVRMVGHRSQHRSGRLLLVSPPRAQSSLFPPLCGTDEGAMASLLGSA